MKVEIQEKNDNKLVKRLEVKGKLTFEGATVSNDKLKEVLAKELGKDTSLIIIKNIYTEYGQEKANFYAVIYADQEAKQKFEMMTKHLKKKIEEDKKKAAEEKKKAAEEKKKEEEAKAAVDETPKEEKKEGEA